MSRGGGDAGFRVGDRCKTRDGLDARILCTDLNCFAGPFPIVAAVRYPRGEEVGCFTRAGKVFRAGRTDDLDLMPETIRRGVIHRAEEVLPKVVDSLPSRDPLGEPRMRDRIFRR